MKIVTIAWIDGERAGEATPEQLEQHFRGTLPDEIILEQEAVFDVNDGSVPDCDVRLSWVGRNGRESYVADGEEWTRRAENCRPDLWDDVEECDESDTYWDRCLRILGDGMRDFVVEVLTPYDDQSKANIQRVERWADDLVDQLRLYSDIKNDAELWDHIDENWENAEWQKANNLDDGPADLPPHQYYDFFRHLWRHTAKVLGQQALDRSEGWHMKQEKERMFAR
jgi:hypothetical protein